MKYLLRSSFFKRQLFTFSAMVIAIIGAFIVFLIFATQIQLENQQLEHVERYRDKITSSLYDWLDYNQEILRTQAEYLEEFSEEFIVSKEMSGLLDRIAEKEMSFIDLLILNREGKLLNSRAWMGDREIYLKDRLYYTEGLKGNPSVSGFYISKSQDVPIMAMGRPVFVHGRVAYILSGIITLEKASEIVSSLNIQKSGWIYLVNENGEILSSEYNNKEMLEKEGTNKTKTNQAMLNAAKGKSGTEIYSCPLHGRVFGSYRWIPELKVGLIVELQHAELMSPLRQLVVYASLLGCIALLATVAGTILFSRRLLRPIHTLISGTKKIIAGHVYKPLNVTTNTELDILIEQFNTMSEAINKREQDLTNLAMTDSLTGLYNHRLLIEFLEKEYSRNKRRGGCLTFVMIDIDNFKKVNDTYGHQVGDTILKELAAILQSHLREGDIVGRYGGEEFGIVLSCNARMDMKAFCERIRKSVESHTFITDKGEIPITISLGFCSVEQLNTVPSFDIIKEADEHLYKAKNAGRNRVSGVYL